MRKLSFLSRFIEIVITKFLSEFYDNKWKPRTFSTDERSSRDLRHLEYINF